MEIKNKYQYKNFENSTTPYKMLPLFVSLCFIVFL